ncbi:MAG: hypothetical protein HWE18_15890 [Gammaproteobacteria bacterium]|nr:hypothetical protein [Gammaproteobacteria bacterium]
MKSVVFWFSIFLSVFSHSLPEKLISKEALSAGSVPLDGMWAFDWQEFHTNFERPVKDGINLPGLWHLQGNYTPQGYGTLRLRISLPEKQIYYLRVPDIPSAVALWVNGELTYTRGIVSHIGETERPEFSPQVVKLPANDTYDFILHISNYHHKEGGVWHQFLIADSEHTYTLGSQSRLIDAMVFSFLMVVSIYLLLINFSKNGSLTHILFSAFIWTIAFRSVMVGERIAYEFIHGVSWLTWQRLEHILLFLALPLFIYFFQRFFSLKNAWFAHGIAFISFIMVALTLFLPAQEFTRFALVNQILGLVTVVYMVAILAVLIKQKSDYSRMFLMSFVVWASLVVHDYLYTHLWIQSRPLAQFGLIAFVIFQLVILWKRRRQETQMLMYVRATIDQQVNEIEVSTQTVLTQKLSLNDFIRDLKPYLHTLNVTLEYDNSDCELEVDRGGLKRAILMLARMTEREGSALHIVIKVVEAEGLGEVIFTIKRPRLMQDMQSQEFNAALNLLDSMGLSLTKSIDIQSVTLKLKIPLMTIQVDDTKAEKKKFGHESSLPILFASEKPNEIIEPLQNYFYLTKDDISLASIAKHRPKLVIWQIHQWRVDLEAEIESIRQKHQNLPILLISDGFYKTQLAQCIRLGITDYIVTPFLSEELILKVQRLMQHQEDVVITQVPHDIRDLTVSLVRNCISLWQKYSGKNKTDLAEASRLWRVYMDGSTAKTRTLDKYLSLQTLPKNPRWETVNRTAHFVMEQCDLNEVDRQALNQQLSVFNQLLSN